MKSRKRYMVFGSFLAVFLFCAAGAVTLAAAGDKQESLQTAENDENIEGITDGEKGSEEIEGEPGRESEPYKCPQICAPNPDGENGWFVTSPEIRIVHTEDRTDTVYILESASGERKEGILHLDEGMEQAEYSVPVEFWTEGKNTVRVRMEPESDEGEEGAGEEKEAAKDTESLAGKVQEEGGAEAEIYEEEYTFYLDGTAPFTPEFSPLPPENGILYTDTELNIHVSSRDSVSGVQEIVVLCGERELQRIRGSEGDISIGPQFYGSLSSYAVDMAGNQSETACFAEIVCENEAPAVQITLPDTGNGWYTEPVEALVQVWEPLDDMGRCSGLSSIICRIDGETAAQRSYGAEAGEVMTQETISFTVEKTSVGAGPVVLEVEVWDCAGNCTRQSRELFLDCAPPTIKVQGVHDGFITAETPTAVFTVQDENSVADVQMQIKRVSPGRESVSGNSASREETGAMDLQSEKSEKAEDVTAEYPAVWEKEEGTWTVEQSFAEEGDYTCYLKATDLAGHTAETELHFTVDKTSPVIRYVDQLNGTWIPYFEWNYGKEEMIRDFSGYTYQMYLDGNPYLAGERITLEGVRILQVLARDEAGNESSAEAIFTIDHTAPQISLKGAKNGGVYGEKVTLDIWVEEESAQMKNVTVNDERKAFQPGSRILQYEFEETGNYRIEVSSEDLAGNTGEAELVFRIEKRGEAGESAVGRLGKVFGRNDKDGQTDGTKKSSSGGVAAGILLAAGSLTGVVCAARYRAKKGK